MGARDNAHQAKDGRASAPLRPRLSIQWHITTNCNNKCYHCYMYDEATYESERTGTLNLCDLIRVLDSFESFEDRWQATIDHFSITGGDPLLRDDWLDFLVELKRRGKHFSMMGNPETLTQENVTYLAELGVRSFQMSLDGLEPTHDRFRSKGSFHRTVEKLELLAQHGIHSNIMFTLFPSNADELIPLMRYVAEHTCASSFSFDVGCFVGNASELSRGLTAQELRDIFSKYVVEKKRLQAKGSSLQVYEKSNLLKVTRFELGEYYPVTSPTMPDICGCLIGWTGVSVLSDGTVLPCRRMPLRVGKMPEQSFEEIFLGSELLKKFRRSEYFQECGHCDFYKMCRGCPASVYSLTGDPFAKNPLCFRDSVERQTEAAAKTLPGPPLTTSFEEEFQLITGRFSSTILSRLQEYVDDQDVRTTFLDLAYSLAERCHFLADPDGYLQNAGRHLGDDEKVFLMHYFSRTVDRDSTPRDFGDEVTATMFNRMLNDSSSDRGLEKRLQDVLDDNLLILMRVLRNMLQIGIELQRTNEVASALIDIGLLPTNPLIQAVVHKTVGSCTEKAWVGTATTAYSLLLLSHFENYSAELAKGIEWLYACQNEDGGMGRFQGDWSRIPTSWLALRALLCCGVVENERIRRVIRWIEGEWFKDMRRGALTYKCSGVLLANIFYAGIFSDNFINTSLNWLMRDQCKDGGWSAKDGAPVGSVPSYTAMALQALASYRNRQGVEYSIGRGLAWMLDNRVDGLWKEHPFEEPVIKFSLALEALNRGFGEY